MCITVIGIKKVNIKQYEWQHVNVKNKLRDKRKLERMIFDIHINHDKNQSITI